MRLAEIADIAEVIGAAAIVVSLIYVGIQVDDSTRAVRSATANETTNAIASWYETVGADQQTAQLYRRGMVDPDSLSAEEWLQFVLLGHSLMLKYQTTFYLAHEGTLDIDISQSITATLSASRELSGFLRYWEQRKSVFEPEFRAYVDDIVLNGTTNRQIESGYSLAPE